MCYVMKCLYTLWHFHNMPSYHNRYSGTAEKTDMRVKRRWDDDVVFKNCSRAAPEKKEANFINDSLRSEFHRKFMNKYIK